MDDYFDVFFHQQAIPFSTGTVLYKKNDIEEIVESCETIYENKTDKLFTFIEQDEIFAKIKNSSIKKHVEIHFFKTQLNWDVLLEELETIFPQFVWTKIVEVTDEPITSYFCEFIPVAVKSIENFEIDPIQFTVSASLEQMNYPKQQSISEILERKLLSIYEEENISSGDLEEVSPFPIKVSVEEIDDVQDERYIEITNRDEDVTNIKSKYKNTNLIDELEDYYAEEEEFNLTEADDVVIVEPELKSNAIAHRSGKNDIIFLKESLKREKASKERVRVAKEKLEYELLAIENSLLVSGLKRFKKYQKSSVEEENWYRTIRIDLIQYDDLYKKAKFIEQSWKLNRQLVTITEKMTVTKGQWIYERARVEKVKNSVSEMDLQSMMEQCHLIN